MSADKSFYVIHPRSLLRLRVFTLQLKTAKRRASARPATASLVLRRYFGDMREGERGSRHVQEADRDQVTDLLKTHLAKHGLVLGRVRLEKTGWSTPYELFRAHVTV